MSLCGHSFVWHCKGQLGTTCTVYTVHCVYMNSQQAGRSQQHPLCCTAVFGSPHRSCYQV
jgi:hypothetical protein